jgi:hypothetical protein
MNEAYYGFVDKIITLSTGALSLSVAFRSSFSGPIPHATWMLKCSWGAFVVAILVALIQLGNRAVIHKLTAKRVLELAKQKPEDWPREGWIFYPPRSFGIAKWIMPVAFAIGIIMFAAFAVLNVP